MSGRSSVDAQPRWLSADEMAAVGLAPTAPEIDFGMRWGTAGDVRVSFAPRAGSDTGYLYAHDRSTDRYLLLVESTTASQANRAWRELQPYLDYPDAYLAMASTAHREAPMSIDRARDLLLHCADRELAVLADIRSSSADAPVPFETARALMVQRSARVCAEQLLRDAAGVDAEPVVVRYRITQDRTWSGQIADISVDKAATTVRAVADLAERRDVTLQATSVTHGWSTIAASRVPELSFAAHRPALGVETPQMAI